jgi:hypothetical protein
MLPVLFVVATWIVFGIRVAILVDMRAATMKSTQCFTLSRYAFVLFFFAPTVTFVSYTTFFFFFFLLQN